MEETTEVCAGTINVVTTQVTCAIAASSSDTNLATSQNNQPISLVGEHHFPPPKPKTPSVVGDLQVTVGPPIRNFLQYDNKKPMGFMQSCCDLIIYFIYSL